MEVIFCSMYYLEFYNTPGWTTMYNGPVWSIKLKKTQKYHFQIQQKNYKKKKIRNPNTQIHDRSIFWIDTGTSMKSGGVKLV